MYQQPYFTHDSDLNNLDSFPTMFRTFQECKPWVQVIRIRKRHPPNGDLIDGAYTTPFLFFLN